VAEKRGRPYGKRRPPANGIILGVLIFNRNKRRDFGRAQASVFAPADLVSSPPPTSCRRRVRGGRSDCGSAGASPSRGAPRCDAAPADLVSAERVILHYGGAVKMPAPADLVSASCPWGPRGLRLGRSLALPGCAALRLRPRRPRVGVVSVGAARVAARPEPRPGMMKMVLVKSIFGLDP
jgi:hypothetical protein